jgi:ubiquinone/menaquinone biosynthesis C-methylase UbiE
MNAAEHFFCSSSLWRCISSRKLLPWIFSGVNMGDHLLEVGAGYGAATPYLKSRVPRVTSLEYDINSLRRLKSQTNGSSSAVCGDASHLPFASQSFSSAVAILMLHHLKSTGAQDAAFREIFRVLRPGGVFLAFEISDSWIHHVGHIRSTYTPVKTNSIAPRLSALGFTKISVDSHTGGFRFSAAIPGKARML